MQEIKKPVGLELCVQLRHKRMERINLTIPRYHKNILRRESLKLGISMSDYIRRLIDEKNII